MVGMLTNEWLVLGWKPPRKIKHSSDLTSNHTNTENEKLLNKKLNFAGTKMHTDH